MTTPSSMLGGTEVSTQVRTLAVDVGGSGVKMLVLDGQGRALTERVRLPTPRRATPQELLAVIEQLARQQMQFDRISVGFPGVVKKGIVYTAVNLGGEVWRGFDLASEITRLLGKPARVINDAAMQGYGAIQGNGVEMVITLGTGMGSAIFVHGMLVPLELGHHPLKKGKTYEQRVCDAERRRIGCRRWSKRVGAAIAQLAPVFNYDVLYVGGGNARKLELELPANVRIIDNVEGLLGGIRLWEHAEA